MRLEYYFCLQPALSCALVKSLSLQRDSPLLSGVFESSCSVEIKFASSAIGRRSLALMFAALTGSNDVRVEIPSVDSIMRVCRPSRRSRYACMSLCLRMFLQRVSIAMQSAVSAMIDSV